MATESSDEPFSLNNTIREKLVQILFANTRALTFEEILASFTGEDPTLIQVELDLLTRGDAKGIGKNHFFKREKDPQTSEELYLYLPPKAWTFFDKLLRYIVDEVLPKKGLLYEKEDNIQFISHMPITRKQLEDLSDNRGLRNYLANILELKILKKGKNDEFFFNPEAYIERKRISVNYQLDEIFHLFKESVKDSQSIPDLGFHDIQLHSIKEVPVNIKDLEIHIEQLAKTLKTFGAESKAIWEIKSVKKGSTGKRISLILPVTWGILTLTIFTNEKAIVEGKFAFCKMHVTFQGIDLPHTSLKAAFAKKGAPARAKSWIPMQELGKFVTQLELIILQNLETYKLINFSHKDIGNLLIPFSIGINYDAEDAVLREELREKGRVFLKRDFKPEALREIKLSQYPILLRYYCYENVITGQLWHRIEEHISGEKTAELTHFQIFDGAFGFNGSHVNTELMTFKLQEHLLNIENTTMKAMQRTYGVQESQTQKIDKISGDLVNLIKDLESNNKVFSESENDNKIFRETTNSNFSNLRQGIGEEIALQVTTLVETIEKTATPIKTEQVEIQKELKSVIDLVKNLTEAVLPDLTQDLQTLTENLNRGFQDLQEQDRQLIESQANTDSSLKQVIAIQAKSESNLSQYLDAQKGNEKQVTIALTQITEAQLKNTQQVQEQSEALFLLKLGYFARKKYLKSKK